MREIHDQYSDFPSLPTEGRNGKLLCFRFQCRLVNLNKSG